MSALCVMLRADPYPPFPDESWMEFKLTYAGPLWGAQSGNRRAAHKHDIRRVFHRQIETIWNGSRLLSERTEPHPTGPMMPYDEWLAEKYEIGGFGFIPLVTERLALSCSLDILMLRPRALGGVIVGGDIDNRLKTLFDALRRPLDTHELAGNKPSCQREPFYCLLEDDKLITRLSVETDTLLEPVDASGEIKDNDVRLVITVKILPYHTVLANLDFVGN